MAYISVHDKSYVPIKAQTTNNLKRMEDSRNLETTSIDL